MANNLLRAPLAGSRHGLTNVWGAYRYQGFGLGEAIGESLLPHQDTSRLVTNNLMGDPTLRLHALPVPQNLHFALSNGHLSLQWESIPNAIGYHVYRASQSTGRYERLTTDPILGNSFEDLTVGSDTGTYSYMIRALALHVSGEGSYVNASSGIIRVANLTRNGSGTIEVQEINPTPALAPLPTPDPVDLTPRTPTIFPISITPSTPRPGDEVTITYRFNPGPTDKSYNVYTHFWSGGIMRFTDEHRFPVPSNQWTENATYDVRLRIPTSAPPGDYKVNVGMFLGGERPEFIPGQGVIVEAEKYYRVGTLTVLPALVSISNAQINPVSVLEGENVHITWDSLDVDFVNIIRQINNQDHQVVASGIPNTGSFDWTATSVPGTVDMTFKIAKTDSDIIYAVSPSLAVVDTLAPESPSGVTAELKDASTIRYIEVKWVPGANSNAVTYKVYRSQISGVYSSPESEVYESVDYIIGPPSGRNFITVTALDLLGNESARSSEVFVDVPQVGASPGISDISDQTTSLNMPVNAIPFTVGDNETAANNLVLYITSNNSVLITPNDVSVSGAGANRTVTLTPSRDKIGSSVVTIYVMDQDHNTASESFVLTVNSVIQPTPTPTPTPVPPTIPSGLVVGDAVVTTSNLNVRNLPSTTATSLGTAPLGTSGTIISGPISANGFTWYQVSYASTPVLNGWSASEFLVKSSSVSPTPTPTPTPTPVPPIQPPVIAPPANTGFKTVSVGLNDFLMPDGTKSTHLGSNFAGATVASYGNVYFGSASHTLGIGTGFLRYNPRTQVLTPLTLDLNKNLNRNPAYPLDTHGKIHSSILEDDGWLYFGTHLGKGDKNWRDAFEGAHVVRYNLATEQFDDLGIPELKATIYAAIGMDTQNDIVYAVTFPTNAWDGEWKSTDRNRLYKLDLNNRAAGWRSVGDLSNVSFDGAFTMFAANGEAWVRTTLTGKTFYYNLASNTFKQLPVDGGWGGIHPMSDGIRALVNRSGWQIFDPRAVNASGSSPSFAQAFTSVGGSYGGEFGVVNDTIYMTVGQQTGSNCTPTRYCTNNIKIASLNANTRVFTDHGIIVDSDSRYPWRLPSITGDGTNAYVVGDWFAKAGDTVEWRDYRPWTDSASNNNHLSGRLGITNLGSGSNPTTPGSGYCNFSRGYDRTRPEAGLSQLPNTLACCSAP